MVGKVRGKEGKMYAEGRKKRRIDGVKEEGKCGENFGNHVISTKFQRGKNKD